MGRSGAMLPVALAALSGCVLPRCLALMLGADSERKAESSSLESVERGETAQLTKMPHAPPRAKLLSWWTEGSRSEWLSLYDIQLEKDATAIVTHAGKNNQEYIDHAVMLGVSLKRHMPDYPRIVLGVKGMTDANQAVLKEAGWHVVLVADWRFPDIECSAGNKSCIDYSFILQQQDSMERLNIFRLPIGRVLYMDADTYVASGELNSLLNGTDKDPVPEGNIGMVPNACNRLKMHGVTAPYSAGVMLFKPNLEKYQSMLVKVAGVMSGNVTGMSDEQIINDVWGKQATALDKKYNCMDPWDLQAADKCQKRCTEVVVSHFFGGPKPAIADERFLSFVRKPSGPFEQCSAMNHGSCNAWQNFYCDLVDNVGMLTRPLQTNIKRLGSCCHSPPLDSDPADCHSVQEDCPETVSFNNIYKLNRSVNMEKQAPWFGNYTKVTTVVKGNSTFAPDPFFHGGRPIYAGPNGYHLFYALESKYWMVGKNVAAARARSGKELVGNWLPESYAYDYHMHTRCPEYTKNWKTVRAGFEYLSSKDSTILVTNPNAEVESWGSAALYKKHKKYEILERKHKRARMRRMAQMEEEGVRRQATDAAENLGDEVVDTVAMQTSLHLAATTGHDEADTSVKPTNEAQHDRPEKRIAYQTHRDVEDADELEAHKQIYHRAGQVLGESQHMRHSKHILQFVMSHPHGPVLPHGGCLYLPNDKVWASFYQHMEHPVPTLFGEMIANSYYPGCNQTSVSGLRLPSSCGPGSMQGSTGCFSVARLGSAAGVEVYETSGHLGLPDKWSYHIAHTQPKHLRRSKEGGNWGSKCGRELPEVPQAHRLEIPTRYVVCQKSDADQTITEEHVREQNRWANEAFRGKSPWKEMSFDAAHPASVDMQISFKLVNISIVTDIACARQGFTNTQLMHKYNQHAEDFFTVVIITNDQSGVLGQTEFPHSLEEDDPENMVVVSSVGFRGDASRYNGDMMYDEGDTVVHEAGHGFGLYHTFEGSCMGQGDYVDDTQEESMPHYDCVSDRSCGGGMDPVHNFMDYSPDTCMVGFTEGQKRRAWCELENHRTGLYKQSLKVAGSSSH